MVSIKGKIRGNLQRTIYPKLGRWRPDLYLEPSLFDGFQDPALREVAPNLQRTRFYKEMPGVQGWLELQEKQILYAFGRWLPGPFLEVGSWVGLSTCHIASGIRDSGTRKTFVAAELNPTVENFRPGEDGIGFYYPAESTENLGSMPPETYHSVVEPVLKSPGGAVGTLRRNLERMGLADFVTIHAGHFNEVEDHQFKFIFIDAMHSPSEIERNAASLRRFLSPGVLLACHDLYCHPDNEACLRQHFNYGHTLKIGWTLIGEIV